MKLPFVSTTGLHCVTSARRCNESPRRASVQVEVGLDKLSGSGTRNKYFTARPGLVEQSNGSRVALLIDARLLDAEPLAGVGNCGTSTIVRGILYLVETPNLPSTSGPSSCKTSTLLLLPLSPYISVTITSTHGLTTHHDVHLPRQSICTACTVWDASANRFVL